MSRVHDVLRALVRRSLYALLLVVPCLLPTVAIVYLVDQASDPPGADDVKVVVRRDALKEDFARFSPRKVFHVGVHVDDVSKIDLGARTYYGRFVLWAKNYFDHSANDRGMVDTGELRIVNHGTLETEVRAVRTIAPYAPAEDAPRGAGGAAPQGSPDADEKKGGSTGASKAEPKGDSDAKAEAKPVSYISYECSGDLRNDFDLRRYPFDRQVLRIVLEPKTHTAESMILAVDPSSALSRDIDFGEWRLVSFEATSEQRVARSDYSDPALINRGRLWNYVPRVVFAMTLKRALVSHLLKELLPLAIIMLMAYGNFYIAPTQIDTRSAVAITGLLAITALHWTARNDLPGVAYVMAMDQFYLVCYALMLVVTLEAIISLRVSPPDDAEIPDGHVPHAWLRVAIPTLRVVYPVALGGGWLAIALRASQP